MEPVTKESEQEMRLLTSVRRQLKSARERRITGKITIEADLKDGGLMDVWINERYRDKMN